MIKVSNKEWIKGIGLVLMFTLGWVTSDLVSQIGCGDCDSRQQGLERRMEMGERMRLQEFAPYNRNTKKNGTERPQERKGEGQGELYECKPQVTIVSNRDIA